VPFTGCGSALKGVCRVRRFDSQIRVSLRGTSSGTASVFIGKQYGKDLAAVSTVVEVHVRDDVDSNIAFVGYAAANCVFNATWFMQPLMVSHYVTAQHLSESAAGLLLSIEMGAMALLGAVLTRILTRGRLVSWALGGLLFAMAAGVLSLYAQGVGALAVTRFLVGVGNGTVLMVFMSAVGRTSSPDRVFARANVLNLIFGFLLLGSLPHLRSLWASFTPLHALILVLIVMAIPLTCIPRSLEFHPATAPASSSGARTHTMLTWLLAGLVLTFGTLGGMAFAVFALVGIKRGISSEQIDNALAIGNFIALPVAGIAALIGARFGRVLPVATAMAAIAVGTIMLTHDPGLAQYRISACLNVAGIYLALPFLIGSAATLDPSGRASAYVGSSFTLSGALGPFLGGSLIEFLGLRTMAPMAVVILTLSAGCFAYIEGRQSRRNAA
jgi:hypothetical protein